MTSTITSFKGNHKFLSNFYVSDVEFWDGEELIVYPTAEHAYQCAKAVSNVDREHIAKAPTAADAKRRGRKVQMVDNWDAIKVGVMHEILCAKFSNFEMEQLLLGTGDADLIEGNTWGDEFWGAVLGEDGIYHGHNWLGRLLVLQRSLLRV